MPGTSWREGGPLPLDHQRPVAMPRLHQDARKIRPATGSALQTADGDGAMSKIEVLADRGLPANPDAERAILGAILLDNSIYFQAAERLQADHFSLDSHRRIYLRMSELSEMGKPIDYVTLPDILRQHKELEAVGGDAYVTDQLTRGMPRIK